MKGYVMAGRNWIPLDRHSGMKPERWVNAAFSGHSDAGASNPVIVGSGLP